jgi:hypothetical protein
MVQPAAGENPVSVMLKLKQNYTDTIVNIKKQFKE